jgi:hypothetical protein
VAQVGATDRTEVESLVKPLPLKDDEKTGGHFEAVL